MIKMPKYYTAKELNILVNYDDKTGRSSGQQRLIPRCHNAGLEVQLAPEKGKGNQLLYEIIENNINLPNEEWVQCYCKKEYEVSNLGRVRKINGRKIVGKNLTPQGYKTVCTNKEGKRQTTQFWVHRLIYFSFHPELIPMEKDIVIDHINGKRDDNRLINLQPLTNAENSYKRDKDQVQIKSVLSQLIYKYNYEKLGKILKELLDNEYEIGYNGLTKQAKE